MEKISIILKGLLLGILFSLFSSTAFAHSGHNYSKLPMKWEFTKTTKSKIENNLRENVGSYKPIGISSLVQKFFNDYNIAVGNKFIAQVNGKNITLQRTSAGILIEDVNDLHDSSVPQIPVRKSIDMKMNIKKISTNFHHTGHDHSELPYEWYFSKKTQQKLINKIKVI